MEESRSFPFTGNLDPDAQEFIPLNPTFFFPYTPPCPPPPPLHPSSYALSPTFTFLPHPILFSPPPPQPQPQPPPQPPCLSLPPQSNSPTRSISLILVPRNVTESTIRRDLEIFGDIRGIQMERILEGIVTVHFYDLRVAKKALKEICGRHMQQQAKGGRFSSSSSLSSLRGFVSGRPVWAQFVVPATSSVPGGCNQGTLVVFNLDREVSSIALRQIFQVYGPIKELRETPYKKQQRFIEFYDIRDAAKAYDRMNGEEINGKQIVIEFSRPGGLHNKFRSYRPPQLPFQTLRTPPFQAHSLRQSVNLLKDRNKNVVSPNNGVVGIEASMSSLCIINEDENKTHGMESEETETKSKNLVKCGKKRHLKNMELSQYLISEETMEDSSCRDQRTTLMIKNIPNKYSQKLLLNMLDNHCICINEAITKEHDEHESHHQPFSSYDFVYLPMDFNNKCNVGYGFVNMTSPEAAWRFYKAFHLQRWEVFNSRKICQITYARVQGLEDLKEHFKSSKFPCEAELYLPVVFSPPRDGKQLTEPVSININGCNGLNAEQMDGQDNPVSESCCGSDNDNSQEDDGFSGGSA